MSPVRLSASHDWPAPFTTGTCGESRNRRGSRPAHDSPAVARSAGSLSTADAPTRRPALPRAARRHTGKGSEVRSVTASELWLQNADLPNHLVTHLNVTPRE